MLLKCGNGLREEEMPEPDRIELADRIGDIIKIMLDDHSKNNGDDGTDKSSDIFEHKERWNAALFSLIMAKAPIERRSALDRLYKLYDGWYRSKR